PAASADVEMPATARATRVFFIINPLPFLSSGYPCPIPFFYIFETACYRNVTMIGLQNLGTRVQKIILPVKFSK
ncbi:hypothetical protein, partial [Vibrio campbellii]|uniref:hypothetical protein n=1 Tax=Vibrio campbellii TaxID=680 RepID=UPI002F3F3352